MGLAFSLVAIEHNTTAPELGDCGMLGRPALDLKCKAYTINPEYTFLRYSFGWFDTIFQALEIHTRELAALRSFFHTYPEDRMLLYSDHDSFEADIFQTFDPDKATRFPLPHDGAVYVDAYYALVDPTTGDRMRAEYSAPMVAGPPHTLTPKRWATLHRHLLTLDNEEIDHHIYRTSPIINPRYDFGKIVAFLRTHIDQPLRIEPEPA